MSDSKTPLRPWIHGLIAAVVTGLGNGLTLVVANAAFDIFKDGKGLLTAAATATIVSVAAYLKQSPLPYYDFEGGKVESPVVMISKVGVVLATCLSLGLCSCSSFSSGDVNKSLPYLRPSASAIGVGLILVTKANESKSERANWLMTVATIVHPFSSETPPTAERLREALMFVAPQSTDDLVQVAVSISSLYASVRERFGPDTKSILAAMEQIALGLEDSAAPYLKTP